MPELVLLADQLLAPVPGGTGRYTRELGAALARTAPHGWRVSAVVTRGGDPSRAAIPGVHGPRVLAWPRRALVAAWERGLPWWPGGDAVHAPTPFAPPRAPRGRALVVTVHDDVPLRHPETLTPRGAAWHRRAITRAARGAHAVVVPTAAVAAALPTVASTVIGHGVTPALLAEPADADAIAARLDLPPRYLLMVGTLEPRKGLDVLRAALADPAAPELPLVLAGHRGWGGVHPDGLRFVEAPSDQELAVLLHRAAVLVAPSRAEGFGLPVLEAMAAGVPFVHSDVPALVEVAGGTGVAAPVGDPAGLAAALRTMLADPEATAARVAAARARAAGFTWDEAARQVWALHLAHVG